MKAPAGIFGLALLAAVSAARADGGAVIATSKESGLDITVFASPSPLRAGPADISVLVQKNGEPVLDAEVSVRWTATGQGEEWQPPCCSMKTDGRAVSATRGHSQNKFLYSAVLPITASGDGKLDVRIERGENEATLSAEVSALRAAPPAAAYWPWLAISPAAIAAFAVNQRLKKKS